MIENLGGFIFYMNHDLADGRIPEDPSIDKALAAAKKEIEFAVDHTTRFGVTKPRNDNGGGSEEYFLWYRWWDTYAKGLSEEKFHDLDMTVKAAMEKGGKDVEEKLKKWRPKGNWKPTATATQKEAPAASA